MVELLVVIAVIALLMAILLPALTRAREMGKRAVCLYRLEQLMLAWLMYADNNDDKIVCGDAEEYGDWETQTFVYALVNPATGTRGIHYGEMPWTLRDWVTPPTPPMPIEEKEGKIKGGALFRYIKNVNAYKCPTGIKDEIRMYSMFDSMNCIVLGGAPPNGVGAGAVMIKVRQHIRKPYERFVFFDDGGSGGATMGAWTGYVYKNTVIDSHRWWDPPPIRHGDGTTFSYADGHSEYRKWKDKKTLEFGKRRIAHSERQDGNEDIRWCSIGLWGSLVTDQN